MARTTSLANDSDTSYNAINLQRMLARLHTQLIVPSAAQENKLLSSSLERNKLSTTIAHASSLLTALESSAISIKNPTQRTSTQASLTKQRELILRLEERLEEYNEGAQDSEDGSSEGEDLLGEDTPSASSSPSQSSPIESTPQPISPQELLQEPNIQEQQPPTESTLRARNPTVRGQAQAQREELLGNAHGTSTGASTSRNIPTTAETLLTHNRTEQEALTESLLGMAAALKASSVAFSTSLEDEKSIVDAAVAGMDKNTSGLESASKRMGTLRSMAEGRGWWGRMMLYAWIAGLAVTAILLVFAMPKLRF